MMKVDKMFLFFKTKNLLGNKSEYDIEGLISVYPFLSRGEAELLYAKLQKWRNPFYVYKRIERRIENMVKQAKKENKPEDQNAEPKVGAGFRKYEDSVREKVIELYKKGIKPKQIVQEMGGSPKVKCVRRWIFKFEKRN